MRTMRWNSRRKWRIPARVESIARIRPSQLVLEGNSVHYMEMFYFLVMFGSEKI